MWACRGRPKCLGQAGFRQTCIMLLLSVCFVPRYPSLSINPVGDAWHEHLGAHYLRKLRRLSSKECIAQELISFSTVPECKNSALACCGMLPRLRGGTDIIDDDDVDSWEPEHMRYHPDLVRTTRTVRKLVHAQRSCAKFQAFCIIYQSSTQCAEVQESYPPFCHLDRKFARPLFPTKWALSVCAPSNTHSIFPRHWLLSSFTFALESSTLDTTFASSNAQNNCL
jgi:hypothetical protein